MLASESYKANIFDMRAQAGLSEKEYRVFSVSVKPALDKNDKLSLSSRLRSRFSESFLEQTAFAAHMIQKEDVVDALVLFFNLEGMPGVEIVLDGVPVDTEPILQELTSD